jgi:CDP-diacylglycerol--serine O-phosphatidyltransferase
VKQQIPNLITLTNLLLGCCAIIALTTGSLELVIWLVAGGAVADFLDGMVARLLGVSSEVGKELDSLSDVVTFGVVPALIFYYLLSVDQGGAGLHLPAIPAFLLAMSSAFRLAKFNLDTRQSDAFLGLPTPASTIFVIGLLTIHLYGSEALQSWVVTPWVLYGLIMILSVLLIAEIPMFSFKIKQWTVKGNEIKVIFAAISLLLLVAVPTLALSAIISLYILINVLLFVLKK